MASTLSNVCRFVVAGAIVVAMMPAKAFATEYSTYRCAQVCKYAQSAIWWDVNDTYRIVESVRYRGGTNNGDCGDTGIEEWYVSGSDVRRY